MIALLAMHPVAQLVIDVAIVGAICWLVWWLIGYMALPEPFNKFLRIIVAVAAVVFLINVLLKFSGGGLF